MLRRLVQIFIILPLVVLLIAFAIANRHAVTVSLDPFGGETPVLAISMPLFLLLFVFLLAGVIIGGIAAWMKQAKWRRQARQEHREAERWRHRAQDASHQPGNGRSGLPVVPRGSG
jgi:uncharacterized integral membrane protein